MHRPNHGRTLDQNRTEKWGKIETASVRNISKTFGNATVVKDVSFSLAQGQVLGLVGPNGAGKTTTIRMLLDILKPDSGAIELFGQPVNDDAKVEDRHLAGLRFSSVSDEQTKWLERFLDE